MENVYTTRVHSFPNASARLLTTAEHLDQQGALSLVVVLGSSVSLVALVFAFITYSLFSDVRTLAGTTLLNMLAALFMDQLLFVVGVGGIQDSAVCVALSSSILYMRLTVFCWLAALAHQLHTSLKASASALTHVAERRLGWRFVQYSAAAWGVPLLLLGLALLLQAHNKGGHLLDTADLKAVNCWYVERGAYLWAQVVPVAGAVAGVSGLLLHAAVLSRDPAWLLLDKRAPAHKAMRKRRAQVLLLTRVTLLLGVGAACGALWRLALPDQGALWLLAASAQALQGLAAAAAFTCGCRLYTRPSRRRARPRRATHCASVPLLSADPQPLGV